MVDSTIKAVKSFLDVIEKIEQDWERVYEEIGKCDHEMSDLLHEIELTEFDNEEGYYLLEELQKVRRRRRELKNYQELIRHLKEYLDRNKYLKINLFKVLTSMERTVEFQKSRTYTPRVRTDLKLCSKENQNAHLEYDEDLLIHDDENTNNISTDFIEELEKPQPVMKYSRERMLESFKQWEMDMEGNLNKMSTYYEMSDEELASLHREVFDAMYEDGYEADELSKAVQ